MKTLTLLFILILFSYTESNAQAEFVLEPDQSMLMTGKGAGQDATLNPYAGQDCNARINNIGKRQFSVRVQKGETIVEQISVQAGESKIVRLLKGNELYLDPNSEGKTKASIVYEKIKESEK